MQLRFLNLVKSLWHPVVVRRHDAPRLGQRVQSAGDLLGSAVSQPMTARLASLPLIPSESFQEAVTAALH